MFGKLRKKLLNHNTQEEYGTIDECGNPITDPTQADMDCRVLGRPIPGKGR